MTETISADALSAPRYAGFWIRLAATIIDDIVLMTLSMGVTYLLLFIAYLFLRPAGTFGESFSGGFLQVFSLGVNIGLSFPYYVWGHYRYGTTIGKRMFHVYVRDAATLQPLTIKQSIIRYLGYLLSGITLMAGYLMAAINPRKQALHDLVAGTVSVYEKPDLARAQAPAPL